MSKKSKNKNTKINEFFHVVKSAYSSKKIAIVNIRIKLFHYYVHFYFI